MIVACECGAKLKVDDAKIPEKGVKVRCPRCGTVLTVRKPVQAAPPELLEKKNPPLAEPTGPLVLIAHDSDVVRTMISGVLTGEGFRVDSAADGVEALRKANEFKPQAMVLDVGLPGIYGFELCTRLKGAPDTDAIKIVLLSSVYDMRRYKRTPVSLYGADDYIEKHHIHNLPSILRRLIFPEQYPEAPLDRESRFHHDLPEMSRPPERSFESSLLSPDTLAQMEQDLPQFSPPSNQGRPVITPDAPITPDSISLDASIFQKEEFEFPGVKEADPDAVEKAKRFARIIVSDIALYNQALVVEGIKNGTFYELLKNDVQEGRELYDKRVPASIRQKQDYFQEAFDNFVTAARRKIQNS
jgi:predicted Zn finger-like uncharacterized protein